MENGSLVLLVSDFEKKYDELSVKLREVVRENDTLRNKLSSTTADGNIQKSEHLTSKLWEKEEHLTIERDKNTRAMQQVETFQNQNENLRKLVKDSQDQFADQKQHMVLQIDGITKELREYKLKEQTFYAETEDLKSKVHGLEHLLDTKSSILQKTRQERDEINLANQKREIEVGATQVDLLTQNEQNAALSKHLEMMKQQFILAERKMMKLNRQLVSSNQKKDELSMKLRELEDAVQQTVKKEMKLGIKERHVEQIAEDYKLELNEYKAKITNMAYQISSLKDQSKRLLNETGEKIRHSNDEIKELANQEISKLVVEIDKLRGNEAKHVEECERSKREKRSAESTLDQVLKARRKDSSNDDVTQLQARLNEERKLKDNLAEQIRALMKKNEVLRCELLQREQWKLSDSTIISKAEDEAKAEMEKMRKCLDEIMKENSTISKTAIKDQVSRERTHTELKEKITDLEQHLHHQKIKIKSQYAEMENSKSVRDLQEQLSNTRIELNRWKQEAAQVTQEAGGKLRSKKSEIQQLTLDNKELRAELQELVDKNADFARQLIGTDRDRAQLNARVMTLNQKLKPFMVKE